MSEKKARANLRKKTAFQFVILIGIVSFFADVTYEGARSVTGPYLAMLGANATIVGIVAGFGEMMGYLLRFLSGRLLDKTSLYWPIAFIGYFINLLAVPLLAFTQYWPFAATLIILERIGKGIRIPPRDVMISYASHEMGSGFAFGLHEAMDRLGATLGPILIAGLLFFNEKYQVAFAFLAIPAILAIIALIVARLEYPQPHKLPPKNANPPKETNPLFWAFLVSSAVIAAGFADFALIAYHFSKMNLLTKPLIPLSYAVAMIIASLTSLGLGYLFDKKGMLTLFFSVLLSSFYAPFVFSKNESLLIVGILLWGLGMGVQGSIMRSIVAHMSPLKKRGTAYGIFNALFGISWFLGSALMGYLYDVHLTALIVFSVIIQLAALPFIWLLRKSV